MNYTDEGPVGLYYEDFEIGRKLVTRGRTVTEADIVQFAALTGDYNPMHTDAEYARNSFAGQRVAHGMLALSYAIGQAYQLGVLERTTIAFRSVEMKFSLPVFIGDTIRAEILVTEKKDAARLGGGLVTLEMRIYNQHNKVVQKGSLEMLMASRPESSAG